MYEYVYTCMSIYVYNSCFVFLALFDAHHDSAPLSTNHLIRLNHKTPYKVYTCSPRKNNKFVATFGEDSRLPVVQ